MARGHSYQYAIDINMTADTRGLKDRIDDIQDRGRDVSHVLRWAGRHLQRSYSLNFTTLGAQSAASMMKGMWPPLEPRYAARKAREFPLAPPMIRTGRLFASVNNLTNNPSSDVDKMEATFAVDSPYVHWHQYGTKNMPARPIVFAPRDFPREFGDKLAQYVSEGKIPND
jgi:phage gpG-like protein